MNWSVGTEVERQLWRAIPSPSLAITLAAVLGGIGMAAAPVSAHGVSATYTSVSALQIQAQFDSGQPMVDAQVSVFSPSNSANPWLQGSTDANGQFLFTPDLDQIGTWEVQVRSGGHGKILYIPVETSNAMTADPSNEATASEVTGDEEIAAGVPSSPTDRSALGIVATRPANELSWSQKVGMTALFSWGCIVTALYWHQRQSV